MVDKTEARLELEARAEKLDVEFAWNLGNDKLAARIADAEAALAPGERKPEAKAEGGPGADDTPTTATGPAPADLDAEQKKPTVSDAAAKDDQSAGTGQIVRVTGPKRGRWRAGRHFTAEPQDILIGDLTEDDLQALVDDPKLTVVGVVGDGGSDEHAG